jgi:hypothetical protein
MGNFHVMEFADTMSDPYEQPTYDRENVHSKMQRIYGL